MPDNTELFRYLSTQEGIEMMLKASREDRARKVKPNSEREKSWHAIVPAQFRPVEDPHPII